MTQATYADNSTVAQTFDTLGNLTQRGDSTGTTSYTYDMLNRRLTKAVPNIYGTNGGGQTITSTYDGNGNLTSMADAGGTVSYGYNAVNEVTSVTEPNGVATTFGYDSRGNRTSSSAANGALITAMVYDGSNRLTDTRTTKGSGGPLIAHYSYSYTNPKGGGDTNRRYTATDTSGNTTSYTYDQADRLTEARTTDAAGSQVADYQYAYDGNGNALSRTFNGGHANYSYNAANQLVTPPCSSSGQGGTCFDANGSTSPTDLQKGYSLGEACLVGAYAGIEAATPAAYLAGPFMEAAPPAGAAIGCALNAGAAWGLGQRLK